MKRSAPVAAACFISLFLGGCSSSGTSAYAQYYEIVKLSFTGTMGKSRITREMAAAIPYASLGYRLNNGNENLLVLATDASGEQLWTARNRTVIVTQSGRIKRTLGLPQNLSALTPLGASQIPGPANALARPVTLTMLADFPEIGVYAAPIICNMIPGAAETVIILGQGISTRRVNENCQSTTLKWRFTNNYWVSPTNGFVWRSIQHIHPKAEALMVSILRPPG